MTVEQSGFCGAGRPPLVCSWTTRSAHNIHFPHLLHTAVRQYIIHLSDNAWRLALLPPSVPTLQVNLFPGGGNVVRPSRCHWKPSRVVSASLADPA